MRNEQPHPSACRPLEAAHRIRRWLLGAEVVRRMDEHSSMISGCVNAEGTCQYLYPETAGYWLAWVADLECELPYPRHVAASVCGVIRGLGALARSSPRWPTRIGDGLDRDWRNSAVFSFDVAAVLRGLAAARSPVPDALPRRLLGELSACVGKTGRLMPHGPPESLPSRWSTRTGSFQAKTAAMIVAAGERWTLPQDLRLAARDALRRYPLHGTAGDDASCDSWHAALYHAEGHALSTFDAAALERWSHRLPRDVDDLRERGCDGVRRHDVWAQALRLGALLRRERRMSARRSAWFHGLARRLADAVDTQGRVPFTPDANGGEAHFPIWTAIFAEQALRWWSDPCEIRLHALC